MVARISTREALSDAQERTASLFDQEIERALTDHHVVGYDDPTSAKETAKAKQRRKNEGINFGKGIADLQTYSYLDNPMDHLTWAQQAAVIADVIYHDITARIVRAARNSVVAQSDFGVWWQQTGAALNQQYMDRFLDLFGWIPGVWNVHPWDECPLTEDEIEAFVTDWRLKIGDDLWPTIAKS